MQELRDRVSRGQFFFPFLSAAPSFFRQITPKKRAHLNEVSDMLYDVCSDDNSIASTGQINHNTHGTITVDTI